jgi:hypothetical protein
LVTSVRVPDFTPSVDAFAFGNGWPHVPLWEFNLFGLKVPVGDAAKGLCGGMVFAVADLHRAGIAATDISQPAFGTPGYRYLVRRQVDSLGGILVPARLLSLMRTSRPERESGWAATLGWLGSPFHSRSWIMANSEWPRVRSELEAGRLAVVILVRVVGNNPLDMGRNHQVLAYGYDLDGTELTLRVYDPNWPLDDDVTLQLDLADPTGEVAARYSKPDAPVVCFFRTPYTPADPVPWR